MLTKKDVHAYLPLQKLMRRYTRSTRMVEKPLINCYVFSASPGLPARLPLNSMPNAAFLPRQVLPLGYPKILCPAPRLCLLTRRPCAREFGLFKQMIVNALERLVQLNHLLCKTLLRHGLVIESYKVLKTL